MKITKWDKRLLELADYVSNWSKDPNKKTGAVIASGKRVISLGFNGLPEGIPDIDFILLSEDKNKYMCHAERNAVDFAYCSLEGCTIYCSYFPCNECAKTIIQKRISRIVTRNPVEEKEKHNWDVTRDLFKKRGIQVICLD